MTLTELRSIWLSSLAQRSKQTARAYESALDKFFQHGDGAEAQHIANFMNSLTGEAATRAQAISAVRAFLRFAMQQGVIAKSPIELLRRPVVSITSANRYLTAQELKVLFSTASKLSTTHHATVVLLALTGLRRQEAAQAQWRHLFRDPSGNIGLTVLGKGSKVRVVAIPPMLFKILADLHSDSKLNASDTTPLIHHHKRAYHADGIWRMVRDAVRTSKIDKPASPHWLRHTAATLAADNGISIYALQGSMGHSNMETSARYLHVATALKDSVSNHVVERMSASTPRRPKKPPTPWEN